MSKNEKLEVTIKYNNLKQTISGSVENVTREYFNVLNKLVPALDLVVSLTAEPSLLEMAARLKGLVYLSKDHVITLRRKAKLEDVILLALVAKYISFGLRIATKDSMTLEEIVEATDRNKKAISLVLEKLKQSGAIDQIENLYRVSDWKAYEYVLRKLPETEPVKITDFVKERNRPIDAEVSAFTVGYEGCASDQFFKSLLSEGVEILVDVRKDAYSKADTAFSEGSLSRIAAEARIKYIHLPELGVDYNLRQELKDTHDYASYFKHYSEYLDKNPDLVSFVADLCKTNTICLMCYEKDFKRCHRSVLASKLEEMGLTFHHLQL